ncbi:RagB/SusD family nutrient uptake outer membrane protein [Hymenobacter wooponensis]|uniref:RagB/SusD family nutrient uptake outer membrane protein n=1 Tax=Hymenobacter wooponensis TaxID=1525360 RepID=A0A4Z0MRI7_9BACT|nr:RagB/SusD family nutrient uptake outer membrane protein [Hymenobacter wooponensis]TGD82291.1 RagB/SusD family nutrient uptake outer membrane protein [Hymenobacter wooponensis]
MKPHKISTLLLAGGLLLGATGCENGLLDKVNPNRPNTDQFWKTENDAVRAVTGMYGGLQVIGTYGQRWHFATVPRSDEAFSQSPYVELAQYTRFIQPNTTFEYTYFMWIDMYRAIFRCNQVLERVPAIPMDETLKKRLLAEALFVRALCYYDMSMTFGNVPLNLTVADATTRVQQGTVESVQAQVITDLLAAKPDLPLSYGANDKGHATRGAAAGLLGRVYMQQRRWAEASAQFAEIISSGQYSLVPNYLDNFTMANENNSESLFEVQFSDVSTTPGQDFAGAGEGNERAQFFGPPGIGYADVEARRWIFDEFTDKTTTGAVDPRREVTLFSAVGTPTVYARPFGTGPNGLNLNPSRFFWRKYQNDRTKTTENFFSGINIRLLRYADILLMQAEALNELKRPAEAAPLVNQVRARVGLTPIATTLTESQMRTQIRHERVTELSGEGMRWYDINRYGLLDNQAGIDELKTRDADFNSFVLGKSKLLPIPQTDIDIDRSIKQNPGY